MFKRTLFNYLLAIVMFAFVAESAFAVESPVLNTGFSTHIAYDKSGKVDSYTLLVPKVAQASSRRDYKVVKVSRVPEKYYMKGEIDIKTKTKLDNGKDDLLQASSALQSKLAEIGVSEIKPFATVTEFNKYPEMKNFGFDRLYTLSIPEDSDPLAVCAELMLQSDIEYACPVYIRYPHHTPNDPSASSQYTLTNMKMYEAWDVTQGSTDVVIAVVDTGTDIDHVDLAANIWSNPGEVAGDNIDNDQNGKIDDSNGWNFAANIVNGSVTGENNNPRNSVNTHGTSVAGCASAATNNGKGIAGVGYKCKILPIKCGATNANYGGIYHGYDGLVYAANMSADVINCSWGGAGYSASEQDKIDYAVSKGCVVVVSAGNDGTNNDNIATYPADYVGVLTVGSITNAYNMSSFSNYGFSVSTFAPGSSIYTTNAGNSYTTIDGTSFSSPNVAGVCGLVKAVHPTWTPQQVIHQIRSTSDRNVKINGATYLQAFGSVNAYKAVTYNNTGGSSIPGIGSLEYVLNYGDVTEITDTEEYIVTATLKNYLGVANGLTVTPVSGDGNYVILGDPVDVGQLASNGTTEVSFTLSIADNCPWYQGHVNVLLVYEATGYYDCELLQIPVRLESENTYTRIYNFWETATSWKQLCAPNSQTLWGLGYSGLFSGSGYTRVSGNSLKIDDITSWPLYSIGAPNDQVAFTGGGYNNQSYIYFTVDGGTTWNGYNLSNQTGFVNDILFFDELNGIMLCDPLSTSEWYMFFTQDGGNTLSYMKFPLAAQSNETGNVGACTTLGSEVWFGTNKGRTFHSSNGGASWNVYSGINGTPVKYAFRTSQLGAVIYGSNSVYYFATTSDGGATWSEGKTLSFTPRYMFAINKPMAYYCVNSDGSVYYTQDEGATWKSVTTYRTDLCGAATNYDYENGTNVIFLLGAELGRLVHKYSAFDAKPKITFDDGTSVDFGTVEVAKTKTKFIKYTNTGDATATISSCELSGTNASEFVVSTTPSSSLATGGSQTLLVKFNPQSQGTKNATLTVSYNGTPTSVSLTLHGVATPGAVDTSASLSFVNAESITFPNTVVNETSSQKVTMKNTGSKAIDITAFSFSDNSTEFSVTETPTISIPANGTKELTLVFAPTSVGEKNLTFSVVNTGDESPVTISVHAVADSVSGVRDERGSLSAYPNPAFEYTLISSLSGEIADALTSIEIYNAEGEFIRTEDVTRSENGILLNTSSLASGMYNIALVSGKSRQMISIIVLK